jgi:esterase
VSERSTPGDGPYGTGPRVVWFVHGILGQGRNWRSFARRLVEEKPDFQAFLPDLRGHGQAGPEAPPHTLAACVADLVRDLPAPDLIVGHSFGGKVALRGFADRAFPDHAVGVILDSPPGAISDLTPRGPSDPLTLLPILRGLPAEVADRDVWRAALRGHGVGEALVAWLLTSAVRRGEAWTWVWDLDVVHALLADYFRSDFLPFLHADARDLVLVRAGRSDRWTEADLALASRGPGVTAVTLPEAGHWVHVDDPEGTFAVVADAAGRAAVW